MLIYRFSPGFSMIVSGPSRAGKTEFTKRFVRNVHYFMEEEPKEIIWCYSEPQSSYDELKSIPNLHMHQGLPDIKKLKLEMHHRLLVFDDMIDEFKKNKELTNLFLKGCQHWNMGSSITELILNVATPSKEDVTGAREFIRLLQITQIGYGLLANERHQRHFQLLNKNKATSIDLQRWISIESWHEKQ